MHSPNFMIMTIRVTFGIWQPWLALWLWLIFAFTQLLIVRQRGQNISAVCWQYILFWKHFSFWCRCNIKSRWLLLQPLPSGAAVSFFLVVVMAQSWTAVSEPGKLQTGIEFGNRYFWIFENGNFWKLAREIMLLSKAIPQSFLGGWIITGSDPVSRK